MPLQRLAAISRYHAVLALMHSASLGRSFPWVEERAATRFRAWTKAYCWATSWHAAANTGAVLPRALTNLASQTRAAVGTHLTDMFGLHCVTVCVVTCEACMTALEQLKTLTPRCSRTL
jgi:hypothetical protein